MSGFKTLYKKSVPALMQQLGVANPFAVPKIVKVVINAGVGKTLKDPKLLENIAEDLKRITGQAPVKTLAKKSVSGFKIRQNQVVGLKVTLRDKRMYDFLEKLVKVALPRVRDFRGLSQQGFDGHGNYTIGFKEHIVFPESIRENIDQSFGFEVSIETNTDDDKRSLALLKSLGFPFQKE